MILVILPEKIGTIIRGFNTNWKKAMDDINSEVMRTFNNFKQGTNILQVRTFSCIVHFFWLFIFEGKILCDRFDESDFDEVFSWDFSDCPDTSGPVLPSAS